MKVTPGRIVQFQRAPGEFRSLHVTGASGSVVTGWVLLSPDDVGCDQYGVIPAGTPQSPWRAYRDVQEGNEVGQWRWPPKE